MRGYSELGWFLEAGLHSCPSTEQLGCAVPLCSSQSALGTSAGNAVGQGSPVWGGGPLLPRPDQLAPTGLARMGMRPMVVPLMQEPRMRLALPVRFCPRLLHPCRSLGPGSQWSLRLPSSWAVAEPDPCGCPSDWSLLLGPSACAGAQCIHWPLAPGCVCSGKRARAEGRAGSLSGQRLCVGAGVARCPPPGVFGMCEAVGAAGVSLAILPLV